MKLMLNNDPIPVSDSTTHLGLKRELGECTDIDRKIELGRRTAYSLLGAGIHGFNGLKQDNKAHIWNTFVVPRILYGLEVSMISQKDVKKLEQFQNKCLKQLQHLPDRTANVACNALMGIIPMEIQIHKNILNLFIGILHSPNSVEYRIAMRQLATKSIEEASFFSNVRKILMKYDLHTAYSLIINTPDKRNWKKMLKESVNLYVEKKLKEEIKEKRSL